MRYAITDETWAIMGPMVERCKSRLGPPPELPDRMFFEAVLYWARAGVPRRDLPEDFGDWSAVYNRLHRWIDSGRLEKLFGEMSARPACTGTVRVMIDSTIARAHQHSAGASVVPHAGRARPGSSSPECVTGDSWARPAGASSGPIKREQAPALVPGACSGTGRHPGPKNPRSHPVLM